MNPSLRTLISIYWSICTALVIAALFAAAFYAPVDPAMGPIQKILYIHLPAAINMFAGCAIVFAASVSYLWQRRAEWDHLARISAMVTVVLCTVVLLTGMIWAKNAWGVWWAWTPRLTFSLILWALYAGYILVRRSIRSHSHRALVSAVFAIVAFLNLPLFYLSIKLLDDLHPSESRLDPAMRNTLLICFVPVTMICAGLTFCRFLSSRKLDRFMHHPHDHHSSSTGTPVHR